MSHEKKLIKMINTVINSGRRYFDNREDIFSLFDDDLTINFNDLQNMLTYWHDHCEKFEFMIFYAQAGPTIGEKYVLLPTDRRYGLSQRAANIVKIGSDSWLGYLSVICNRMSRMAYLIYKYARLSPSKSEAWFRIYILLSQAEQGIREAKMQDIA